MNYEIYSVKDVVIGSFSDIKIMSNEAHATRWFKELCEQSKIKEDLQLYRLGVYSTETGCINSDVVFIVGGANV